MNNLLEGLNKGGVAPAGPPRWVYHEMDEKSWTIEACLPVTGVSSAPEGLTLRRFEGGRGATALHVGPYDELGMAYRELEEWIEKQGLTPAGPGFDIYLNDPTEVKDPQRFETEVVLPVK
jgi:effector-binding domain-containing protein